MRVKKWYFGKIMVLAVTCVAVLTVAAVIPSPVSTVADAAVLPIPRDREAVSAAAPLCEVACDDNVTPYCSAGQHLAWLPSQGATFLNGMARRGSHPTVCYSGSCAYKHDVGQCQARILDGEGLLTPETTEDLRQAIAAADATVIQALLRAHPSQLSFNVKRSAIQVVSCNGSVSEHMPLPQDIVRTLVAAD